MVIITKGAIHEFSRKHPTASIPLNDWHEKVKRANWKNFSDIKASFNSVDALGEDRYVFDIAGNNFRLIAMIHFNIRTLYIRAILTHAGYDTLSRTKKLSGL